MTGCLNNKQIDYMRKETKSEIYQATVGPITTYALEKRDEI